MVGASGYLGGEVLRLLVGHEEIELAVAQAGTTAGSPLSAVFPSLAGAYGDLELGELDPSALEGLDVVFVALPSGTSQDVVASLVGKVGLVVDLGADHRLKDASAYEKWYGFTHSHPELLDEAAYGLPELFRKDLPGSKLIAAPGCYVTASCLALAPFLSTGAIDSLGIVVDAVSGTSGAGKSPSAELHHPKVNEQVSPYKVTDHRHIPEMEQVLGAELIFTPHLAPMTRGILATCYARPAAGSPISSTAAALELLDEAYGAEPFVQVGEALVATGDAYGSNVCHLTARYDERTGWLVVLSAIDNLIKGGSGQAVQAANVALGLPETMGLPLVGMAP